MRKWILMGGLAAMLALSAPGSQAKAGEYHVYSCRTPDGEVAPVDGWSGSVAPGGAKDDYAEDTCPLGGALIAALGDETTHVANTDRASWVFEAPTFDHLTSADVWRAGDNAGGGSGNATYEFWLTSPPSKGVVDQCIWAVGCFSLGESDQPLSGANSLAIPATRLGSQIAFGASCGGATQPEPYECAEGQGDHANYAAVIYVYAADLTLEQAAGPSVGGAGGELASAPTVGGTSDLTFNASDPGAGVFEAVFSVDGKVVQDAVINEEGGRCRNVGQASDGLPAFLYLQPCPASVSADVGFDTTHVSNGPHHLVVSVLDAAGNAAQVLDRTVTIANPGAPGPPNGSDASSQAQLVARWGSSPKAVLVGGYGRQRTIRGRLTGPGGKPISGAQIDVLVTPAYTGAKSATMKDPRTAPDGQFTLRLPAGASSRTIRLAYRAHLGDPRPAAEKTLKLTVKAALSLSISPRTASVGSTIRFRGRLLGGPVPAGGKPLVLEARSGGSPWIEFDVIRSDRRGRYRASYTFKFPGPAGYQFRVLCEGEADYPFATGASPVLHVFEH